MLKRILQPHTFENDGSYWTEVVILVTPSGFLDKAKIKYLENRFHHIITKSNRYIMKNGNTPRQSPVQKKTEDMLEEFILNTELIIPTLGHKVFDPLPSENNKNTDENCLYMFDKDRKNIMRPVKLRMMASGC